MQDCGKASLNCRKLKTQGGRAPHSAGNFIPPDRSPIQPMHRIQQLAQQTVLYGISTLAGRLLHYLLVVAYTSVFLPETYGLITEFYAYAAFFNVIYTYGLETSYFRFAAQGHAPQIFSLTVSTLCCTSLLFSGLLTYLATPLINALGYAGCERYVYYLAVVLATDAWLVIPLARLRLQKRIGYFVAVKLWHLGLTVALNFGWLYALPAVGQVCWPSLLQSRLAYLPTRTPCVDYVFLANALANVATLPLFIKSFGEVRWQLSWPRLRPMLSYAFPLLLMGLAGTANEMLSRALLRHWLPAHLYVNMTPEAVVGIFGACYKLSIFMFLGVQAFRYAAEPIFFLQARDKHAPALFSHIMHAFILCACFLLLVVTLNLDTLSQLLLRSPMYRQGIDIVPHLSLAYLCLGVYYNLSVGYKLADKTYLGACIAGIGLVITLLGNWWGVPRLGYWGSVWATLSSYLAMSGLAYHWGQKHYPIPYRVRRELGYVIGTWGLALLFRGMRHALGPFLVPIHGILILAFVQLWRRCMRSYAAQAVM